MLEDVVSSGADGQTVSKLEKEGKAAQEKGRKKLSRRVAKTQRKAEDAAREVELLGVTSPKDEKSPDKED